MSTLQKILERYGQTATLIREAGEQTIQCFLQPDTTREETVPGTQTAIGWLDQRLWTYTGLEEVQPGDRLRWRETVYRVRSSRAYGLGDDVHHWWASLEIEREAAE